ncbi:helix-turn-helix domain-containing protein [Glutamicibacter arilaitensis]|uniref:helix-turn-helix domain-containing protein n=1 Tax=Glutamicibacter arilaitensis TaxID=256701 RepID=UPI00384E6F75
MSTQAKDELLIVAEAAERLRMHQETVREYIRRGDLPAIKFTQGGRRGIWKIRESAIERFLRRNEYAA